MPGHFLWGLCVFSVPTAMHTSVTHAAVCCAVPCCPAHAGTQSGIHVHWRHRAYGSTRCPPDAQGSRICSQRARKRAHGITGSVQTVPHSRTATALQAQHSPQAPNCAYWFQCRVVATVGPGGGCLGCWDMERWSAWVGGARGEGFPETKELCHAFSTPGVMVLVRQGYVPSFRRQESPSDALRIGQTKLRNPSFYFYLRLLDPAVLQLTGWPGDVGVHTRPSCKTQGPVAAVVEGAEGGLDVALSQTGTFTL
jgi:hypothetical protein